MKKKLLLSFAVFATALSVNAQKRADKSISPIKHENVKSIENVSFDSEKTFNTKSHKHELIKRGSKTVIDTLRLIALNKAYGCRDHAFVTDRPIKSKLYNFGTDKYYVSINQAFNNSASLKLKGVGVKLVSYNAKAVDFIIMYKTLAGKDTAVKITQNVPKYTTAATHFFTFPSAIEVKDTFEISIRPNSSTDSLLISTTGIYNRKAVAFGKISNDTLTVDNTKITNNNFTTAGFFQGWMTDADGWMAGGGFAPNFSILTGKNILPGTKVLKQFSATKYIVSKSQNVALDTIFGTVAQLNEEETYGYQSVYKVPASGAPQLLSSSLWDDGVSVAYKSDAYVYPLVEYVFNTNPVVDNKCLGNSKTVNANLDAPSYGALVKNPLFNKNAFYGKYLNVGKKDFAFYALALGLTKQDTLDFFSNNLTFSNTYSSDATNDTLTIVEHILGYGFKSAQYIYNVTDYLISSKVSAEVLVSSAIKCNGGDAEVTVSAIGGFAAYTGTGVKQSVKAGNASYDVTDANGCKGTATINVTEPTTLTVVASEVSKASNDNTKDGVAKVVATGGTSPYTYVWSANAGSTSEVTVGKGNYSVVVTDINGCVKDGSVVITAGTASISELAIEGLSIYPNPTSTNLTVAFSSKGSASIELVNVAGQVVDTKNTTGVSNTSFDMTSLETGVYFVNIKVAEGTAIFKVVKD